MSMVGSSYPVARSTGICAGTGRVFVTGEQYIATLVERDEPGAAFERRDFCMEAWKSGSRPAAPLRLFGVWRAIYHESPPTKKPLLDDAELLDLFEQLGEATDTRQIAFRYVLGLLLVRRRLLRMVGSKPRTQDAPAMMLVLPKGEPGDASPMQVIDPGLDEAAVAEVIEQVGQIIATAE